MLCQYSWAGRGLGSHSSMLAWRCCKTTVKSKHEAIEPEKQTGAMILPCLSMRDGKPRWPYYVLENWKVPLILIAMPFLEKKKRKETGFIHWAGLKPNSFHMQIFSPSRRAWKPNENLVLKIPRKRCLSPHKFVEVLGKASGVTDDKVQSSFFPTQNILMLFPRCPSRDIPDPPSRGKSSFQFFPETLFSLYFHGRYM